MSAGNGENSTDCGAISTTGTPSEGSCDGDDADSACDGLQSKAKSDGQSIIVRPYQWEEEDDPKTGQIRLYAWCLNRQSDPCVVYFDGFPAYCYVELPLFVNRRPYRWNQADADDVYQALRKRLEENAPFMGQYVCKPKFYYYQPGRTFPFLLLAFHTKKALWRCMSTLTQKISTGSRDEETGELEKRTVARPFYVKNIGKLVLRPWEADIGSVRKLMTIREFHYCQWLQIPAILVKPENKISTLKQEYIASWKNIKAVPPDQTEGWMTYPRILSWDIECYSDRHNAMPNKYKSRHVAYMISIIFQQLDRPKTRRKILILMGDCYQIKATEIIKVKTETELCDTLMKVVDQLDPEILIGYNIYGFDWPYLDARLKRRLREWLACGSRLTTDLPSYYFKEWRSSGYGFNAINYLKMRGRINIDLLPVIKRKFKYPKYTLNEVAKRLLGDTKHDVSAKQMFLIYEQFKRAIDNLMTRIGKSANEVFKEISAELSEIVGIYSREKLEKITKDDFEVMIKTQLEQVARATLEELKKPGMLYQKTFTSFRTDRQVALKGLYEVILEMAEALRQMTIVAEYAMQDAVLPYDIFEKTNLWMELTALANVVDISPLDLITRGQQMRGVSLIFDLAVKTGYVVDTLLNPKDYGKWKGATVIEPLLGMHDGVECDDFSSLYPSIIMANNISYDTMIPPELYDSIPEQDCNIADGETKEGIKFHVRYIKKEIKEGVLAKLERRLVTERKGIKKQIKQVIAKLKEIGKAIKGLLKSKQPVLFEEITRKLGELSKNDDAKDEIKALISSLDGMCRDSDPEKYQQYVGDKKKIKLELVLLDCHQLALKVTANSMYGMLGIKRGAKLPMIEGAMAVTYFGRTYIEICTQRIRDKGGIVVYGDTDSVMYKFPGVIGKECLKLGKETCEELTGLFPEDLVLEPEKAGRMFSMGKKKYVFWMYDKNGNLREDPDGMMMKGNILARRDNCQWQRDTYGHILMDKIMRRHPYQESLDIIIEQVVKMYRNQIPWNQLVVIKGIGANYKNENYPMKIFGDELRRLGKIVNPGDRLDYLVVNLDPHWMTRYTHHLGYKMRSPEVYDDRLQTDHPESADTMYYIENILQNCVEQIFYLGYKEELDEIVAKDECRDYFKIIDDLKQRGGKNIEDMLQFMWPHVRVTLPENASKDSSAALVKERAIELEIRQRAKGIIDSWHRDYRKEVIMHLWSKTGASPSFARIPYIELFNLMVRLVNTTLAEAYHQVIMKDASNKYSIRLTDGMPHEVLKKLFNRLKLENFRAQIDKVDPMEMIQHLRQTDEAFIQYVWNMSGGDPRTTLNTLVGTKFKNFIDTSYRRYLGRNAIYYRITGNPIKTLIKAIKAGSLDVAVKLMASKECYARLYPDT